MKRDKVVRSVQTTLRSAIGHHRPRKSDLLFFPAAYPMQSSLALLFPEAEIHLDTYRKIHDPSAQHGFPPHISIIWPFMRPDRIDEETLKQLKCFFEGFPKLDLQFRETGRSPTGLYLRPEPREPIIEMILAAMKLYPDFPPYGISDYHPNPHVTVAHEKNPRKLEAITSAFDTEAQAFFPIRTRAEKVWLLEEHGRGWERRVAFELA